MTRRWRLWLPLLGLGAWLALFGDKTPTGGAALPSLPARTATATRTAGAPAETLLALLPRATLVSPRLLTGVPTVRRDLFTAHSWNPPVSVPAVVAPAPTAPPLPFVFLGKKLDGGVWEVYLGRSEQTFIVLTGQVLEGTYRIDKIEPPILTLTYLPLGQSQTLPIGDSQ